jgi:hypothetical protein
MAKKNLYFCGFKKSDSSYLHAEICVFANNPHGSCWDGVRFTWQANRDGEHKNWYGFRVEMEARLLNHLNQQIHIARRIMTENTNWETPPDVILDRLEKIATEVVYDSRLSQYIPLSEIMPASVLAWRDNWQAMGKASCTVGCLAETREEAQDLILLELAKDKHYHEYMIDWLKAERPVLCLDDKQPDTQTARERLTLNANVSAE